MAVIPLAAPLTANTVISYRVFGKRSTRVVLSCPVDEASSLTANNKVPTESSDSLRPLKETWIPKLHE